MNSVRPLIRYLIACEDIQSDLRHSHKATLVNLINAIRSLDEPAFPFLFQELCVFVQLTECRGEAEVELRIIHEETDQFAYPGPARPWKAALPNNPLEVMGLPFRIRNIEFPEAGLYWIQFWYNGDMLAQQPLVLKVTNDGSNK